MSCQSLHEAIVDIARGTEIGAGTRAAVECHVGHCASCRLLMARERQLSSGLRALAAASPAGAPDAMERRLMEAFARRHGAEGQRRSALLSALWVAAALVVVAGGAAVSWSVAQRQRVPESAKPAPIVGAREIHQPVQAPPVAGCKSAARVERKPAATLGVETAAVRSRSSGGFRDAAERRWFAGVRKRRDLSHADSADLASGIRDRDRARCERDGSGGGSAGWPGRPAAGDSPGSREPTITAGRSA